MSTLAVVAASRNAAAAVTKAAAWQALSYVSGKEADRDTLADGASYAVSLRLTGTIDGAAVDETIDGRLSVGHASQRQTHSLNHEAVVAALLSRMSKTARAKAVKELPGLYAESAGRMPTLLAGDFAEANALLAACKAGASVPSTIRGAVRCEYALASAATDPASVPFVGTAGH